MVAEAAAGVEGVGYTPNLKPRYRLPERSFAQKSQTRTGHTRGKGPGKNTADVHLPSRQDAQPPVPWRHTVGGADLKLATSLIGDKAIFSSSLHGAVTAPRPRPVPMLPYCSPEPYRTLVSYRAGNTSARINPNTRCDAIGSWRGTSSGHVLLCTCHGYLIALPTLQWPLLLLSISEFLFPELSKRYVHTRVVLHSQSAIRSQLSGVSRARLSSSSLRT